MTAKELGPWLAIAAAILSAGIWLGALQQRVVTLENEQRYLHGSFKVPEN